MIINNNLLIYSNIPPWLKMKGWKGNKNLSLGREKKKKAFNANQLNGDTSRKEKFEKVNSYEGKKGWCT